jgi:hypothetical protein
MTAFSDYVDLRTAVIDQLGDRDIAKRFDRITKLAEAQLNNKLRMSEQITNTTVTFASGSAPLPADFLEVIGLYDSLGREYVQHSPQKTALTNAQTYFSEQGGNLISPNLSGDYDLQYYAVLSTLTASMTQSNWLLQKYPDVYFYAVLAEASRSAGQVEPAAMAMQMRDMAIRDAVADDTSRRFSRVRVRVGGPTP